MMPVSICLAPVNGVHRRKCRLAPFRSAARARVGDVSAQILLKVEFVSETGILPPERPMMTEPRDSALRALLQLLLDRTGVSAAGLFRADPDGVKTVEATAALIGHTEAARAVGAFAETAFAEDVVAAVRIEGFGFAAIVGPISPGSGPREYLLLCDLAPSPDHGRRRVKPPRRGDPGRGDQAAPRSGGPGPRHPVCRIVAGRGSSGDRRGVSRVGRRSAARAPSDRPRPVPRGERGARTRGGRCGSCGDRRSARTGRRRL